MTVMLGWNVSTCIEIHNNSYVSARRLFSVFFCGLFAIFVVLEENLYCRIQFLKERIHSCGEGLVQGTGSREITF